MSMVWNLESTIKFPTIQDIDILNCLRYWVVLPLKYIAKAMHSNTRDDFWFCEEQAC